MARTPDIRTRAVMTEWACVISVSYVKPKLNQTSVVNLIAAGGITCGIGDWRQEKGSGSHGQFRIVGPNDKDFLRILKNGGRAAQQQALADALCEAFEKSAPVLSQALSDALQAQFERVIGRGVVGWLKRILIAGILILASLSSTKARIL